MNSDFERRLRQFSGTRARQERPKRARAHEEGQNEPQEAPRARQERQERQVSVVKPALKGHKVSQAEMQTLR